MDSFKVVLEGPAPWGFRLQGGKDFSVPLSISRMREELMKRWRGSMLKQGLELKHGMIWPVGGTPSSSSLVSIPGMWVGPVADPSPGVGPGPTWLTPGGKAAQAGVAVGDWVLSIDGENAGSLTHIEAQNKIRACGERLSLGLSRAQPVQSKPQKTAASTAGPRRQQAAADGEHGGLAAAAGDRPVAFLSHPCPPHRHRVQSMPASAPSVQDPDEEHLKKSRHLPWGQQDPGWGVGPCQEAQPCRALNGRSCSQVPRTEAPAPASSTPQEPWPGATTPSPTSRPPWAVDPAFAERYAPDKTSTVLTRHSQPATPTPLQNRTSIVQAAAGGGPGGGSNNGKTPVCHQCHKVIRGRYLVALGHAYHPEEFVCSQCGKVLEEGGFFEEKGAIFCPPCYDVRYAPSCAKCKKKITGEIMHALKMTWHVHCFTCAACKTPIRNRAFYMEEGVPYCERDYEKMFGTKCHGCDFKIDAGDRFLEALGFSWHDTCFVCAICQINLEGKTFYSKKDRPLCKSHAFSHV
ncbi:PDZ and LIM domain protein 7 isoform X3 [Trachypithecus francoisi]|uniref:PDZ and LIM domain protein 7 isoform X3 n=1 Tax=Trachypithecus francoisi TaxID=54180 RepID=UPI00141B9803|nr:PDZ and LIM domain protein 7 isoform X3 [Trachypithecus francoisi]